MEKIKDEIASLEDELIALRRDFHKYPELGYQEFRTSGMIAEYLSSLGLEVTRLEKTGVVGLLKGEGGAGKTLLLRADMDALPIEEQTDLTFKSEIPGVMHACGHDGHCAIQLIVAKVLANHKDEIKGCVKFVFQPNEEEAGALDMIQAGVLENPKVDAALALHLWSAIPSGKIGLSDGPVLGTTEEFELKIIGKSGHTSAPHTALDPILGAAKVIDAVQSLATREFDPLLPIVIMFGKIHSGSVRNAIPDFVELGGTIRFLFNNESVAKPMILESFERVIKGTCAALNLDYELNFIPSNPSLVNDPAMVALVKSAAADTYSSLGNVEVFRSLAGEDFAEFSQRVPSVMTFVGINNPQTKSNYPHHNSSFDIDEAMLKYGAELQVRSALRFLSV
ncbi:M20 metallopeptidase family protein [Desulfosporosinus meridiei]|uniref:Amidohydrolase n=1 Tax=Desulfosporosinus meridiei (strain ATCC BAA-275 / DSM 13257 / KCTC 12902 / NCIMB 13706 / S10) TaxID=768704 RepID=J7IYK3_DESMD|nr:amidohydrolase [Desulfosporosinus meridiei]AFQ45224.1 amidohydrolase [Desulfosporosinus meridiei DSM 13257]